MSKITPYKFQMKDVRVIDDGEGSFEVVAKDVAESLGYSWQINLIANVPEEWKGVKPINTPGGVQQMATLKEPGLYFFLNRSDKPAAMPMQMWVNGEVLPSVRKTGAYTGKSAMTPLKATAEAARAFPPLVRVARMLGCDKNSAAISANQAIYGMTNINLMEQLGHTHLEAENQDSQWYTPTELGALVQPVVGPRNMNLLLAEAGLQMRVGDKWQPTDIGKEFGRLFDTSKKRTAGTPVMQLKWSPHVLPMLGEQKDAA